jgi:hypothetical protein
MAWESRGNNRYYYRKRWVGKKVVSEYVGKGPAAEEAAGLDLERRKRLREDRDRMNSLLLQIKRIDYTIKGVITGVLLASGFHNHKGQWRKKRDVNG